ncbi:MAG: hypothetical protein KC613_13125, partial [Myxococcales bacterium]|nr:hypothetical protein [Myxococcales bacterium]
IWRSEGRAAGGHWGPGQGLVVWDTRYETRIIDGDKGGLRARRALADGDWRPHQPPRTPVDAGGFFAIEALPPTNCAMRLKAVAVQNGQAAALCEDGTLSLARPGDAAARSRPTPLVGEYAPLTLAWLPDGRLVAGGLRGRLVRFDADGRVERVVPTGLGAVRHLEVSPDGRWVAALGSASGVALWAQGAAAVAEVLHAHGAVRAVGFLEGGRIKIVGREGQAVYGLPGGAPRVIRAGAGLAAGAVSDGGRAVLLGDGAGAVLRVDLHTGTVREATLGKGVVKAVGDGPWGPWAAGMFAPPLVRLAEQGPAPVTGGRRLRRGVALPDGSLVGIDVHMGLFRWTAPAREPARHGEGPYADLAGHGDGWLTLSREGAVERWRVGHAAEPLRRVAGAQALAVAAGRVVVVGDGAQWWGAAGEGRLPGADDAPWLTAALTPDGRRLAVGDLLGRVQVYRLPAGALEADLPGHTERVVALTFLPDGDLLSVSWDGTARFWALGGDPD